jgi:hypothetical protein
MTARLLFRVEPVHGESPRGYLCRVASEHGYSSPAWLAQVAGLQPSGLDRDEAIRQLSYTLRLEPDEWHAMCYPRVASASPQRSFCGKRISTDDLNYGQPRLCSVCLRERPIWWAAWDLALVVACPAHRCLLTDQCLGCQQKIAWERPAVYRCQCGFDFRRLPPEPADPDLIAINAAIYCAAEFPPAQRIDRKVAALRHPAELARLKLGPLLRLILFMGSIKGGKALRRKQRPFTSTSLAAATEVCRSASELLHDWPRPFREALRRMIPQDGDPALLNFNETFGNFYRHLFQVLPRSEFGFLHEVFETFVAEDWPGLIRGQHRYFSATVRRRSPWVALNVAERIARTTDDRLAGLVRQGQLDGILVRVPGGVGRTECWIRKGSLERWIGERDRELARYMTRPQAERALGLKYGTVMALAHAGVIHSVEGPDSYFPAGFHFLREDIIGIKHAFENNSVPEQEYLTGGTLVALRHALKNYLGRYVGLPAVIRAVVNGDLAPVGYTRRFPGITGYLFWSDQLRRYRPVPGISMPGEQEEGFLNYGETGALLGVPRTVIRGLVEQGVLTALPTGNGLAKLVPARDVQRFADEYLSSPQVAKLLNLGIRSVPGFLHQAGVPVLSIPVPGKGQARFVRKEIAGRLGIGHAGSL